jgi:hypothetical protein
VSFIVNHVESYVIHGPSLGYDWTDEGVEVWEAMRKERDAVARVCSVRVMIELSKREKESFSLFKDFFSASELRAIFL